MDPPLSVCCLCNGIVPPNISDEVGDRLALFTRVTAKENVLALEIAPEDWTDEIHASFIKSMWNDWKDVATTCEEDLEDDMHDRVFEIVYETFWEEYGNMLKEVELYRSVHTWYDMRVKLGNKEFHKWIGKKLRFKSFCERFYGVLRERYNVSEAEMWEEFEKVCVNKWTFDRYAQELNKKMKK